MKITRASNGMLTYRYSAGRDISFEFHMLCEVGAPYQAAARRIIQREGWKVDYGRSIDAPPWCADFAMPKPATWGGDNYQMSERDYAALQKGVV